MAKRQGSALFIARLLVLAYFIENIRAAVAVAMTSSHVIEVMTGRPPPGGRDGVIHVKLLSNSQSGSEVTLRVSKWPRDFTRGHMNEFTICQPDILNVDGIHIRGDESMGNDGWNIDKIAVTNQKGQRVVIPVFTTILGKTDQTFPANDVALPQHLPKHNRAKREDELAENQRLYEFMYDYGGIPLVKAMPIEEFLLAPNSSLGLQILAAYAQLCAASTPAFESLENTTEAFCDPVYPAPSDLYRWKSDVAFGMQRLVGNVMTIKLCTEIPEKLGLTKIHKRKIQRHIRMNLIRAVRDKRIFIVDLEVMDGMETLDGFFATAPIALLFQRGDGILIPIAIQLQQQPSRSNPIFLPSDSHNQWILAKMWFNLADANHNNALNHMAFSHFKMEGVIAVTKRQIHSTHPIYKLLMPHFLYTLAINKYALELLLSSDGYVPKVGNYPTAAMLDLMRRTNEIWRLDTDGSIRGNLRSRGLDDPQLLPHFYYRKDGLRLYDVIFNYVSEYVNLYYQDDSDITNDMEIQAWREEIVAPVTEQGLGMLGVPGEGDKFTTRDQLITVLADVIFICTGQHSASGALAYENFGYPANFPVRLRGIPPRSKCRIEKEYLLQTLPDKTGTYNIMVVQRATSGVRGNSLGDFEVEYITDPEGLEVVEKFRNNLATLNIDIEQEMDTRLFKYDALKPEVVRNSINI